MNSLGLAPFFAAAMLVPGLTACHGAAEKDPVVADSGDSPCVDGEISTWYRDADADGYGEDASTMSSCEPPEGYLSVGGDCDDGDGDISPAGTERCDGVDDDCDGDTDETGAADASSWYADLDGDGHGDADARVESCEAPSDYVASFDDCDDDDAAVHPDAAEICADDRDSDCDGDDSGVDCSDVRSLAEADLRLVGMVPNELAGSSFSATTDVDGDGLRDLFVGAPYADYPLEEMGRVYVVYASSLLAAGGADVGLGDADLAFNGESSFDHAGATVAGVGDVDGDGLGDLIAQTGGERQSGLAVGAACLFLGGGALASGGASLSFSAADLQLDGESALSGAGAALAGLGDLDGDGLDDLLVGAPGDDDGGSGAGAVYLLFGGGTLRSSASLALSEAELKVVGPNEGDYAGASAASAGDVDGDGVPDVLVGAYGADDGAADGGGVYLLLGGGALASASGSLSLTDADFVSFGESALDGAGTSLAAAGDVDGDGLDDLLVGTVSESTVGSHSGAAYLLKGGGAIADGGAASSLADADLKLLGEAPGDLAGWVAGVGDLDADGLDEIAVGAFKESSASPEAGAAYVLYGGDALAGTSGTLSLSGADRKFTGEAAYDLAGGDLGGAGDLDGDGFDELLIGASSNSLGKGSIYLYDGDSIN